MVATLALLQAWSAIGQEMQESLSLDSEVTAPVAITDFLNDTGNDTDNDTQSAIPVDTNLSTTDTQNAFLDLPVNQSLIDTNLSTTDTQSAFLDLPFDRGMIDTNLDVTSTQEEFLLDQPAETPGAFYQKHQMMGGIESEDSSADQTSSFFKKHQMMG